MNIIAYQKFCLRVLGKHQCHLVLIWKPLKSDLRCLHCLAVKTLVIFCIGLKTILVLNLNPNKHNPNVWTRLDDKYYGGFCFVNKQSAVGCSTVDGIGWISMGWAKYKKEYIKVKEESMWDIIERSEMVHPFFRLCCLLYPIAHKFCPKYTSYLGTSEFPKMDEFSENFQTAPGPPPPPSFRKTMLRF